MNETIGERIQNRLDELGLKQVDLIKAKVASKGTISLWLSSSSIPSGDRLVRLADFLQVNSTWILSGTGDKLCRSSDSINLNPIASVTYVPILSWSQVGAWTDMESIELTGEENSLPLVPGAGKGSFYLNVNGISNSPYYVDGEKICIDPNFDIDNILTGEMVVVSINGEACFRALLRSENKLFLKALNNDWQPNIIELEKGFTFVGKYVGSFKEPVRHIL